jgi:hypothetical protein
MKKPCLVLFSLLLVALAARPAQAQAPKLPDTGISGVYEVMVGTRQAQPLIKYFGEFGFRVVDSAAIPAERAKELYGVASALKTYRLQNGDIDSHGLLRLLEWASPLGDGVGYSMPETIGQRMAVMMTKDVIRLVDLYKAERANGKKWLPFDPIFDDLYGLGSGQPGFFNRPVGVRETVVYGDFFVHVFFQRYGYTIPGYGTIGSHAPLQTSEFTHHDFVVKGDLKEVTRYYSEALGLQPEEPEPVIDGDWQKGPQRVFDMPPGYSHWYRGFVSPNNICGKLKFFVPRGPKPDRSEHQRVGELGITLHSLHTPKLQLVHDLVTKQGIRPTKIQKNELGENSFTFIGPDGVAWQVIEKATTSHRPATKREFVRVNN